MGADDSSEESARACIHCGSTNLVYSDDKQGFGTGKAVVGALLLGPLGLAAGAIGKNKRHVYVRCDGCLRTFTGAELIKKDRPLTSGPVFGVVAGVAIFCTAAISVWKACASRGTASMAEAIRNEQIEKAALQRDADRRAEKIANDWKESQRKRATKRDGSR